MPRSCVAFRCGLVSDVGVCALAALSNLAVLDLTLCENVTDKGVHALSNIATLRELNLSFCEKVGDYGVRSLADLPNLQVLSLRNIRGLTDEGVEALACGLTRNTITELDLSDCRDVSDAGVEHLCGLERLRTLDLSHCGKVLTRKLPSSLH